MLVSILRKFWGWKGLSACVFFAITLLSSVACQSKAEGVNDTAPAELVEPSVATVPLSWENPREPERKDWSRYVSKLLDEKFTIFDQVRDMDIFCPRYKHLDHGEKINVWAMLISEIAYYESGWDPTNRYKEPGMGTDPVTGGHVYSEGLLQLSYQDAAYRRQDCEFNWSKDKVFPARDPRRSILNPYTNLKCGVNILEEQIAAKRAIVLSSGVYWSTLRSYNSKVPSIAKAIKERLKFCD